MLLSTALFILYFTASVKGDCNSCPENWIRHGSSCYLFVGTKETWMEAEHMCKDRGAVLAAIETAAENAFLRGYLKTFGDFGVDLTSWIGGTDMEVEGIWKWSPSGEAVVFTDWGGGDPDQSGDCMLLWGGFDYKWGDYYCHSQYPFLCEKTITSDTIIG